MRGVFNNMGKGKSEKFWVLMFFGFLVCVLRWRIGNMFCYCVCVVFDLWICYIIINLIWADFNLVIFLYVRGKR